MTPTQATRGRIASHGYAIVQPGFDPGEVTRFLECVRPLEAQLADGGQGGVRDIFRSQPLLADLVRHRQVREIVQDVLGPDAGAVRGILFDKQPDANWKVPWHQDLTIAVQGRHECGGFGPWSTKAGIPHVRAPAAVLERMLTVRVHLDDCGGDNGPLRVIPGSHRYGNMTSDEVDRITATRPAAECTVSRGGLVVMRPLLVHASSPAVRPVHRRVIHLEFAAAELPDPLRWFEWWPCSP